MSTSVFLLLLLIGAVAFFLMRGEQRAAAPASPDGAVLEQLRRAGSDLSQPHPIEFFLYFPDESAAGAVREYLVAQGFAVRLEPSQDSVWSLVATKHMVPAEGALAELRSDLTQRAAAAGGEYDGWGTPVVPPP